ncbi:MAG TPA: hypothetical protein DEQ02_06955 [Ruminococcaceae bacterium]|nr:hypothetical protein [Oscillospiraceae bacterium]
MEKARRQGEQIIADTQASALQLREEGLRQLDLDIQQKKNELDALKKGFWELRKNYKQSFDNTIKHLRDIQSGLGDIIESDAADAQE